MTIYWTVDGIFGILNLSSLLSPGIGYASVVIVSLLNVYYIVILAWGLYYLFQVRLRNRWQEKTFLFLSPPSQITNIVGIKLDSLTSDTRPVCTC